MKETLHPVHQTHDGFLNTVRGKKVSIHNPTVEMINLWDIANGLGNICRFGGQTPEFYSVAQHSILVYLLAPRQLKLHALMHDATEAYLGDVIKPLKNILGHTYTDIEKKFESVIAEWCEIDVARFKEIKPFDRQALEMEYEYFFKKNERAFDCLAIHHRCYQPKEAAEYFFNLFDTAYRVSKL